MKKGIIYLTFSTAIFVVSAYLINIFLARNLGPVDYGTYGLVISVMTLINLIQTAGLPQATSKFISSNSKNENEILRSSLVLQFISTLIITLIYYLLAPAIALILKDLSLIPYLRLSSLIFPLYGIFALYTGYYNGLHQFNKQALINIIYSIAKLFSVIGLAYAFHLHGAIAGFIFAPLVTLFVGFKLPKRSSGHFAYKKLIGFSIPLIAFAFFSMLAQSIDLYFVKALLTDDNLTGFYAANQNVARIPYFALSAFSVVLFPSISKSLSEKTHELTSKMISQSLRYTLLILLPLTLLISATSSDIIEVLFSKTYLPGAFSLSILTVSFGFLTIFSILANIINGAGSPYKSVAISLIGVFTSAILCYFLLPVYGLTGAAIATGVGGVIAMAISGYVVYKRFTILVSAKSTIRILIAALVAYFVSYEVSLPLYLLPLNYLLSGIVYLGLLIIMKEIVKEDFDLLKSFSKKQQS